MSDEEKCFSGILNKYYSSENSEENIIIYSLISRLKRVFNWNVEDDNLYNKEKGPEIVRNLIIQFNSWKSLICTSNNLSEYVGLQHLAVYTLAKLCLHYWIKDSEIVAEVLRLIYTLDGHFSYMFAQIIKQNERSSSWQETRQKEYLAMVYFVTHAHNAKLEFSGVRFVDLKFKLGLLQDPPIFLAAFLKKPQLLLLLLRHGAIIDRRLGRIRPYEWDFNGLLRYLIMVLQSFLGTETEDLSWNTVVTLSTVNDVCLCLRFLLRAIPQIRIGQLDFSLLLSRVDILFRDSSHAFIRAISERKIVPTLMSRYLEPSELRHLCRVTIREALNKNWNLPYGVFSLPLPNILQRYVNLSDD